MRRCVFTLAVAGLFIFLCLPARGQISLQKPSAPVQSADNDKDPKAILELGAATSWNVSGGPATFAPNFAAEITPIENWLELEAGVSPFYTHNAKEWDTDLLFKKTLDHVEEGGIYARSWPTMGSPQTKWKME
jgi:hypothetical protein